MSEPHAHSRTADRLLFQARNAEPAQRSLLIAQALSHAQLAHSEEQELANLIAVYRFMTDEDLEHPLARLIIRRQIRRRLGLFPPLSADGSDENGDE
jgi:hypothetical protein